MIYQQSKQKNKDLSTGTVHSSRSLPIAKLKKKGENTPPLKTQKDHLLKISSRRIYDGGLFALIDGNNIAQGFMDENQPFRQEHEQTIRGDTMEGSAPLVCS